MFFVFGLFRTTNQLFIPDSRLSVLQNTGHAYLGLGFPDSKFTYLYRVTSAFKLGPIQQKTPEMNVSRYVSIPNTQVFCLTPSELRERSG